MSSSSEVVFFLHCDYPGCAHTEGPDPNLNTLRADMHTEDGWVSDGPHDYCGDHAEAAWQDQRDGE